MSLHRSYNDGRDAPLINVFPRGLYYSDSGSRPGGVSSAPVATPLWFFRLTHTRLADAILDVCGIPQKDSAKKACLQLFARCSAPAPGMLLKSIPRTQRKRSSSVSQSRGPNDMGFDVMGQIEATSKSLGLSKSAEKRLGVFLTNGCSPLPAHIDEALDTILLATSKVRLLDGKNQVTDPRRLKRYEEIARVVKSLKQLVALMKTMGIGPLFPFKTDSKSGLGSRPLYIALDLGLRQRRKHFNGQLVFQAIVLPDNFFDTDPRDKERKGKPIVGLGTKVAEGGRYDDLVRGSRRFVILCHCHRSLYSTVCLSVSLFFINRFENIVLLVTLELPSSAIIQLHRFPCVLEYDFSLASS